MARAAAIYRVDDIYIYHDRPDESKLIRLVLCYLETPQYLRKRLFRVRPELRYVGTLPPLRTPHHPLVNEADKLEKGEFREGVVLSEECDGFLVDVGVDKPLLARGKAPSIGSRTTVQVTGIKPILVGRFASRREIDLYWGYDVHIANGDLGRLVQRDFDLTIATSRHAAPYTQLDSQLRTLWNLASNILVAFGSPRKGVGEVLAKEKLNINEVFHYVVNMIPHQGCETVRTEEAIHASLAIMNLLDS